MIFKAFVQNTPGLKDGGVVLSNSPTTISFCATKTPAVKANPTLVRGGERGPNTVVNGNEVPSVVAETVDLILTFKVCTGLDDKYVCPEVITILLVVVGKGLMPRNG